MKTKTVKTIEVQEWDAVVEKTYGRPYNFQQQDGGKQRGSFTFSVPAESEDYLNAVIPATLDTDEMGVSFGVWLTRDPKQKLTPKDQKEDWCTQLWWKRNFYPDVQMVANDLHAKGLLEAGDYLIDIDW